MAPQQRGDDCLTTLIGGTIALIFFGGLLILILSFLFG